MLAEMGVALDLVAAIVGHESGGKDTRTLVRHYVRTDMLERKAHALKAWDERLKAIVTGEEARRWCAFIRPGDRQFGPLGLAIVMRARTRRWIVEW